MSERLEKLKKELEELKKEKEADEIQSQIKNLKFSRTRTGRTYEYIKKNVPKFVATGRSIAKIIAIKPQKQPKKVRRIVRPIRRRPVRRYAYARPVYRRPVRRIVRPKKVNYNPYGNDFKMQDAISEPMKRDIYGIDDPYKGFGI